MYEADHIIDIGPGAGVHGGRIVAEGSIRYKSLQGIRDRKLSKRRRKIPVPLKRRQGNGQKIEIVGASENNLKN